MIDHTLRPVLLLDGKIVNYVNLELRIKVDDGDDVVLTHFNAERARMVQLEAAVEALRTHSANCLATLNGRPGDTEWLMHEVDALIAEAAPMLGDG